ncbi:hypothetical protein [Paludifilum halophilum]|uniref:Uncharacterized protein n=1 Tax=Paludifilum halophilum TaxID=1642702 RepID=A0A235B9P4_9BACL|nr:hypothetical protein [Paludifilum halophilum]OYD08986.1 hypothetical protein CHM34_04220 [Paludifilum halophilum]
MQFEWTGDQAELETSGDKEDQFYSALFSGTNALNGYNFAFYNNEPITVEYSAQYKSNGSLVGIATKSGFAAEWRAYDDNWTWYSQWYEFIYDY